MAKEVIVYQANPLIEGRREFSLLEARIFYLGLRDIVPRITNKVKLWGDKAYNEFPPTRLSSNELVKLFGNCKYYSTLEEICDRLIKKSIKIKRTDGKGYSNYTVFAELTYNSDEGLKLEFSPKMIPWLLDLADKPFTKLPFEQIWALRSSYALRLFELLLQYQNTKTHERTLSIEELRNYLGVADDKYQDSIENFRRRVIESSIRDINEKTSYKVEYEKIKDGRKIVGFKFKLYLPAELKREKQKKKVQEVKDIIAGLANGKSMTGNNTPSDSRKRPMPDFMVTDKDGNKIKDPYDKPVKITKDGKVVF